MSGNTNATAKPALLALPAELRNEILHYALVQADALYFLPSDWTYVCEPPFLHVCKQTRQEGLPIFYGGNYFASCWVSDTLDLVKTMPRPIMALIKHLRVLKCDVSDPYASETTRTIDFEYALARVTERVNECVELSGAYLREDAMFVDIGITEKRSSMPALRVLEHLEKEDEQALLELAKKHELS